MASTDAIPVPRKNTAFRMYFAIRDTAGDLVTSWAGQDSEVSKDGGSFDDCTNEATEIGTSGCGYIDFTSTEMNADSVVYKLTVTNTDALSIVVVLYPEEVGDYRGDNTNVDAIKAKTDQLVFGETNQLNVNVISVNGTGQTNGDINQKLDTIDNLLDTEVAAIKDVTDKLNTAMVLDGAVYQFTANALELAPSAGGGSATIENQELILAKTNLIGTAAATAIVRQASSKITLYIGERHSFTINVNNDYTARDVTLCFEAVDATTDLATIVNAALTKLSGTISFAIPEALTADVCDARWSIRDTTTKEVLEFGLAYIREQALAD